MLLAPGELRTEPLFADDAEGACAGGRRLTLDERMSRVWEGLRAAGTAECPLCGGRLELVGEVGRCGSWGTTVS